MKWSDAKNAEYVKCMEDYAYGCITEAAAKVILHRLGANAEHSQEILNTWNTSIDMIKAQTEKTRWL